MASQSDSESTIDIELDDKNIKEIKASTPQPRPCCDGIVMNFVIVIFIPLAIIIALVLNDLPKCAQVTTIDGWMALNIIAFVLHVVTSFVWIWPVGVQYTRNAQIIFCMSAFCLLGAILWFEMDSPMCTGPGVHLGIAMRIDIVVMVVQFFGLFCSVFWQLSTK